MNIHGMVLGKKKCFVDWPPSQDKFNKVYFGKNIFQFFFSETSKSYGSKISLNIPWMVLYQMCIHFCVSI